MTGDNKEGYVALTRTSSLLSLPPELLGYLSKFLWIESLPELSQVSRPIHQNLCIPSYRHHAKTVLKYSENHPSVYQYHSSQRAGFDDTRDSDWHHMNHFIHRADYGTRWSWAQRLKWAERIQTQGWEKWNALGNSWQWDKKRMPVLLKWTRGRMVVGRGDVIDIWQIDASGTAWRLLSVNDKSSTIEAAQRSKSSQAPSERVRNGRSHRDPISVTDEISGVSSVDEAPDDLIVSYISGLVKRLRFIRRQEGFSYQMKEAARYASAALATPDYSGTTSIPPKNVQAIHAQGNLLATVSSVRPPRQNSCHLPSTTTVKDGKRYYLDLYTLSTPWVPPTQIALESRPWSVFISTPGIATDLWRANVNSKPSFAVVGSVGVSPLAVHWLSSNGEPHETPTFLNMGNDGRRTSVYALCNFLGGPGGGSETIWAGCYDSLSRLYDLRQSSKSQAPALILRDLWSDDPVYSIGTGGPCGSYVAVGGARNAAVRVFDTRMPKSSDASLIPASGDERLGEGSNHYSSPTKGITLFASGQDRSPVYGIAVEYSRIWGVTEKRIFSLDFERRRAKESGTSMFQGDAASSGVWNYRTSPSASSRQPEPLSYYLHDRDDVKLRKTGSHFENYGLDAE